MRKFLAMVMVLMLLCLSLVGCGAKAKEPTEEEYMEWAERAWDVVLDAYENYDIYMNCIALPVMSDSENQNSDLDIGISFLAADDLKKLTKEQMQEIQQHRFYQEGIPIEETWIPDAHAQIHALTNNLLTIETERESFSSIPELYNYMDEELNNTIYTIDRWQNEFLKLLETKTTRQLYEVLLPLYCYNTKVYKQIDSENISGQDNIFEIYQSLGGLEIHIEPLKIMFN